MVKRVLVALGICMLAGVIQGCQREETHGPDVWAIVNGHEIKRDRVEKYYCNAIATENAPATQDEALSRRLDVLETLITNEIMMELAQKQGLAATEGEVEDQFTQSKAPYTEDDFLRQLKGRCFTPDDFKQQIREKLTIQKLLNREVASKVTITDQDVTDYYNQNHTQYPFNVPETLYHLARIIVTPVKDAQILNRKNDDATTDAEAKRKIGVLLEKLNSGADFGQLALDYSEDPTTSRSGGDMGSVPQSSLDSADPALKKAVLALKPGQTSGVIATKDAYYILKLVGKEAPGQRELSDTQVSILIRDTLRSRKEQLLNGAFLVTARNNAKITNYLAQQVLESGGKLPMPTAPSTK
jgi:peptidyl-prolyl cis-trans isomerase SurA